MSAIIKGKNAWKPRRRGSAYCSPACGFARTWASYQAAQLNAKALAKHLGPGWLPHIWENFGWHWEVVDQTDDVTVGPAYAGGYFANIVLRGSRNWTGRGRTARAALRNALKDFDTHLKALGQVRSAPVLVSMKAPQE